MTDVAKRHEVRSSGRHYETSDLPVLGEGFVGDRQVLLLQLYTETCASWRALVDVRFKLLGLVPAASLALIAVVLGESAPADGLPPIAGLLVTAIGFLVTLGLYVYDLRNSQLHDDLISRARRIESELGMHTGAFLGRLKSSSLVQHDVATRLIYWASLVGWIGAAVLVAGPFLR